jgi:2,3-dihydroxybenzoate-AMP ligase
MERNRKTHAELIEGWTPHPTAEAERYVAEAIWPALTSVDLLERNARRVPGRLAFADDTSEVTWAEFSSRVDVLAKGLSAAGVKYGDFFVLQLPNVLAFFYLFFALNRLGAIPIQCLPRHRRMEVEPQVQLHKAVGIAVSPDLAIEFVDNFKDDYAHLKVCLTIGKSPSPGWRTVDDVFREGATQADIDFAGTRPSPADICLIGLSGGTTGIPKSIPRTYYDTLCQWDWIGRWAGATDRSVVLVPFPAGHLAASQDLWGPMTLRGGTTVATALANPEDHFRLLERYRVTHTMLIPAQLAQWRNANTERYDLSSLKVLMTGGQKLKPALATWAMNELNVSVVNVYGMTEGPALMNRWTDARDIQTETVGYPLIEPELEMRLVDDNNRQVPDGAVGEACFKGAPVFRGYFRSAKENAKSFDGDGFFHSGDLLVRLASGAYMVHGRKKDMIIRAGENVYPEPVEDLLASHPKVLSAACVGMPDEGVGEKLCAFVQPREGGEALTLVEVKSYLRDKGMAIFQWPERLVLVKQWPLTPANKISKRHLRGFIAARLVSERVIEATAADEYLQKDELCVRDVLGGAVPAPVVAEAP